jgi:hypothetical protein
MTPRSANVAVAASGVHWIDMLAGVHPARHTRGMQEPAQQSIITPLPEVMRVDATPASPQAQPQNRLRRYTVASQILGRVDLAGADFVFDFQSCDTNNLMIIGGRHPPGMPWTQAFMSGLMGAYSAQTRTQFCLIN